MKKQEIANLIFESLNSILTEADFRLKKSEDGFVRKYSGGKQMIGLPLWDFAPYFEFSLNICIRIDAVEEIFHKFSGSQTKYHPMSFTTITRLEHFTRDSGRYKVKTAADVTSAVSIITNVIRDKIIPFFNSHQDVKTLDAAVNCQTPGVDITHNPSGAMHSVILARLAENSNFDFVVSKHQTEMQLAPDVAHPFNQLVEFLKTHLVS